MLSCCGAMINVRKLSALDIVLHGSKLIIAEFAVAVILPAAIGGLSLARGHAAFGWAFALYMFSLSLNYLPLLLHAIAITRSGDPKSEVEDELRNIRQSGRRYGMQSLLLLVPLLVFVLALIQAVRSQTSSGTQAHG